MTHRNKDSQAQRAAPCPFCGEEPIIDGKDEYLRIRCEPCGVQGPIFDFHQESDDEIEQAERDAIAAWNRRAAPPALDAEGLPELPKPVRMSADQAYLGYTAEQVRQAQREAIAADRLGRHGQQPARASVADDPKFLSLLADIYSAGICYSSAEVDRAALIAHINAWGGVTEDHTKQEK